MRRVRLLLTGLVTCAVLAACSTEDATDVTATSATLNGTGITGARAMEYWFDWGLTDNEGRETGPRRRTPTRSAPANTPLSPVADDITGLTPRTNYSFRLCGRPADRPGDAPTCAGSKGLYTESLTSQVCRIAYASCSTMYATDVTEAGATLVGRGFTPGVPVTWWFEWAPQDTDPYSSGAWEKTPERTTGADEPTATRTARITGLELATDEPSRDYAFRLCRRVSGEGACTDGTRFTVRRPEAYPTGTGRVRVTGDAVGAPDGAADFGDIDIDVSSGESGAAPSGALSFIPIFGEGGGYGTFRGLKPICVNVVGNKATVNFFQDYFHVLRFVITDNGGNGTDTIQLSSAGFAAGDDCGPTRYDGGEPSTLTDGRATVDADG